MSVWYIFHFFLLFVSVANSYCLPKVDLTSALIDPQDHVTSDLTVGFTANGFPNDEILPVSTEDARSSSPVLEDSNHDFFAIANLPDLADRLLTLDDPAIILGASEFAQAGCSTEQISSHVQQRWRWKWPWPTKPKKDPPAVCKQRPIEEISPEAVHDTPMRGPKGEKCRGKRPLLLRTGRLVRALSVLGGSALGIHSRILHTM